MWIKSGRRKEGTASCTKWESEHYSDTMQARDPKADILFCSELNRRAGEDCSGLTFYTYMYIYMYTHTYTHTYTFNLSGLLNILHLESHPPPHTVEKQIHLTLRLMEQGHLQQLHPQFWSPVSQLLFVSAPSCHPPPGSWAWASPFSPVGDQGAGSGRVCTKTAKILTLISFYNGDIFIALFHQPPQNPKCSTNEEISASTSALMLQVVKKAKPVSVVIVHCSHIQLLLTFTMNTNSFSLINY